MEPIPSELTSASASAPPPASSDRERSLSQDTAVAAAVVERLGELFPGAAVGEVLPIGPDAHPGGGATDKAAGYGSPLRVTLTDAEGARHTLVLHVARPDVYGHARPSDHAQAMLLAFETFREVPTHARALDVGAICEDRLVSLASARDYYLLTEWVEGRVYADDLRRIVADAHSQFRDVENVVSLARLLAALHEPVRDPPSYRRAIRDLIGHGEGVFGIIDGYPAATPAADDDRLAGIERLCADWRWRLRGREGRLVRMHGDFHPFNVLFDRAGRVRLLDASRGALGDPADDVTAMAVNFLFFAADAPHAWRNGLRPLWRAFWSAYQKDRPDPELEEVAPPYLAWRTLVVCNPGFYPRLSARGRDRLLGFAEQALHGGRVDLDAADDVFR